MNQYPRIKLLLVFLFANSFCIAQFTPTKFLNCGGCKMRTIVPMDFDMDGDIDMIMDNHDASRIDWMTNDGKGNFSSVKQLLKPKINQLSFFVVDFDDDGDADIFTDHDFSDEIFYHENQGNLVFKTPVLVKSGFVISGFSYMGAEDFDLDGKKELIVSNLGMRGLTFFEKLPDNTFKESLKYNGMSKGSHRFTILDFDKDGDKDIIGQGGTWGFNFFENEGNGKFEKARTLMTFGANQYASSFDIADVDDDGDYDIMTGRYGFYTTLFINNGGNYFPTNKIIDINKNVNFADVYFSDVDGDGDQDIVLDSKLGTGNNEEHSGWYENYGNGDYSKFKEIFSTVQKPDIILLADIDNDGDEDFISKSYSNLNMFYKKNLYQSPFVLGQIYQDENGNAVKDLEEKLILTQDLLRINPEPVAKVLTEGEGFKYYLDAGYYTFKIDTGVCWSLTTPKNSYAFQVNTANIYNIDFGLKRKSEVKAIKSYLSSMPTRCGFTVPFHISTENTGCRETKAKVSLVLDKLVKYKEAVPAPSLISGDTLWWDMDSMPIESHKGVTLKLEIAGVEFQGDTIRMPVKSYIYSSGDTLTAVDSFYYTSVINCSYDPNDKLNYPSRGTKNYTLSDEELFYVIRFQNTGKDTAFTVELRDTLNANLDLRTLRTVESSHGFSAKFNYSDREFRIRFDNILLPDSSTNEAGSHGFFAFVVKPKQQSYKKIAIRNKASIFFDYNPPVKTNLTLNTLVDNFSCIDSIGPRGQEILPMQADHHFHQIVCHDDKNAKIILAPKEGIPPYRYQNNVFLDSLLIDSLAEGSYYYSISDNGNCIVQTDTIKITNPSLLSMQIRVADTLCFGEKTMIKFDNVNGGVPPYRYLLNEFDVVENELGPGIFHIKVKDKNGCIADTLVHIFETNEILVNFSTKLPEDVLSKTGLIEVDSIKGGVPPFKYNWSTGEKISKIHSLGIGIYTVTITDAINCQFIREFDFVGPLSTSTEDLDDFNVSPNPFSDMIHIQWSNPTSTPLVLSVVTMDGKQVYMSTVPENTERWNIDISKFGTTHIFNLELRGKNGTSNRKLVRGY